MAETGLFWRERSDLPPGLGYPLFGRIHLLTLLCCGVFIVLCAWGFSRLGSRGRRAALRGIPCLLLGLELWKTLLLVSMGRYSRNYLPLHPCSLGIPVFFLQAFSRAGKWKDFWGQISLSIIPLGGAVALLTPNWIDAYPPWNFLSLHSYLWHCLLLVFPLCLRISGQARLDPRRWYDSLLFLGALILPMRGINRLLGTNYLFVSSPVTGTAFDGVGERLGDPGFLLGYLAILLAVLLLYYGIVWLAERAVREK